MPIRTGLLLALTTGCVTAIDDTTVIDEPVHTVRIDLGKGDLSVTRSPDHATVVHADVGGLGQVEGLSIDDGVLTIDLRCGGLDLCGADLTVEVPEGAAIEAEVRAGDAQLEGLDGPLWVVVSAGSVDADGLRSDEAHLAAAAGDVHARFDTPPEDLHAVVGAGHVELEVPAGTYDVELDTRTGHLRLDGVQHRSGAPNRIRAESGAGSVEVVGR